MTTYGLKNMSILFFKKKSDDFPEKTDDFPERLKKLVQLAKKADRWCRVFGAETHNYKFNPVVSPAEVREFEERNKIALPDDFVKFLTEVGNGGAGVDYGVYTLEKIQQNIYYYETISYDSEKTIFDYENYTEKWAELCTELDNTDNDAAYSYIEKQLANGMLIIGTAGCTYDYALMCKGKNYGKIVGIDWNLFEDCPPEVIADSFSEWIENHFTKIINGDLIDRGSFKIVRK